MATCARNATIYQKVECNKTRFSHHLNVCFCHLLTSKKQFINLPSHMCAGVSVFAIQRCQEHAGAGELFGQARSG